MKAKLAVDPKHTFNIYVADLGGGLLGWTTLPEMLVEDSNQNKVVVLDESLPGGKAYRYNIGYTLVHEAGHYLGLYHTFQVSDSLFIQHLASQGCSLSFLELASNSSKPNMLFLLGWLQRRTSCYRHTGGKESSISMPLHLHMQRKGSDGLDPIENFVDCSDDEVSLKLLMMTANPRSFYLTTSHYSA